VTLLSVGDGALLLYDATMLARGSRVTPAYAMTETFVGGLQFLYGIGAAVKAEGGDQARNAALLSAPLALFTHGLLSMALPEESSTYARGGGSKNLAVVPAATDNGITVIATGTW
jgi:hypothetical protein